VAPNRRAKAATVLVHIIAESDAFCENVAHGGGESAWHLLPHEAARFLKAAKPLANGVCIADLNPNGGDESDCSSDHAGAGSNDNPTGDDRLHCHSELTGVPLQSKSEHAVGNIPMNGSSVGCTDCNWSFAFFEDDTLICPCGGMVCHSCLEKFGIAVAAKAKAQISATRQNYTNTSRLVLARMGKSVTLRMMLLICETKCTARGGMAMLCPCSLNPRPCWVMEATRGSHAICPMTPSQTMPMRTRMPFQRTAFGTLRTRSNMRARS